MVNRVGDFGFLLGIALILMYTGSLDYATIFALAPERIGSETINVWGSAQWSVATLTCILLFIGAMGKSAQVPLHIWLPDSMEGPTPISALIHAATMVTAGIFMVSRMHPLFEMSEMALSFILVIGATTALFMGLIGIVQNDIKRVIAYSTLSQLGYMTVALGASAYAAAIFHLMTHAFFKALLFLGAGAVIIAMHHEQDVRKMGGLRKLLPITFATAWIGTLALTGFPGTSGFFSKDAIIEAVHYSHRAGSGYAYFAVMAGVFVTAFYSFRLLYLAFHGEARFGADAHAEVAADGEAMEHFVDAAFRDGGEGLPEVVGRVRSAGDGLDFVVFFVGDGTPPDFDLAFIGEVLGSDADGSRQGLRSTARAAQLPTGAEEGFLPAVHRFAGEGDIPQVGFGVEDFEIPGGAGGLGHLLGGSDVVHGAHEGAFGGEQDGFPVFEVSLVGKAPDP